MNDPSYPLLLGEDAAAFMVGDVIETHYERRWFGRARWTTEKVEGIGPGYVIVRPLKRGWERRPRGTRFVRYIHRAATAQPNAYPGIG